MGFQRIQYGAGSGGGGSETPPEDAELILQSTRFFLPPDLFVNPSISSDALTATTHRAGFVCQSPKTGNLTKVKLRLQSLATPQDLRVRIETVSGGTPTGTLVAAGATVTIPSASLAVGTIEATLTTPLPLTIGQKIAVVVDCPGAVPSMAIAKITGLNNFPYPVRFAASWTKDSAYSPIAALCFDGVWTPGLSIFPVNAATSSIFNVATNTNPDERGNKITIPFECKVTGIWWGGTGTGAFDLVLYDETDTVIDSVSFDANGHGNGTAPLFAFFDSEYILARDDVVRVVLKPTTTSSVTSRFLTIMSDAIGSWSYGSRIVQTSRVDAGVWTDDNTNRNNIGLIISQIYG